MRLWGAIRPRAIFRKLKKASAALDRALLPKSSARLDLNRALLAPFVDTGEPDEDEETKIDNDAERLLSQVAKDETVAPVAEALLTTLAYEFAGGQFRDLHTAYTSLRQALQAAEQIRKRGEMPPDNTGSQLNAVMAEVAKLNDQGALADADALLDAEERRMREDHASEKDRLDQQAKTLLDRRLDQDRLRNRPDLAAQRLIADLYRQAPAGGVFWATNSLANQWGNDGDKAGDMFALQVALALAKTNYDKVKGKRKALEVVALYTLGICHLRLAQRSTEDRHLNIAKNAFKGALKKTNKAKEPVNWSARQDGPGQTLREMGERASDPALLQDAVTAHRAALDVAISAKSVNIINCWNNLGIALRTLGEVTRSADTLKEAEEALTTELDLKDKTTDPLGWETTQNNLAVAQRWRGAVTHDLAKLDEARVGFAACEALEYKDKAAFQWAVLQWNIADLALARFQLDPDAAHLTEARDHLTAARAIFVDGSDYQTQRCDDLLAEIDAAQAG
jgi:hypothetical protein